MEHKIDNIIFKPGATNNNLVKDLDSLLVKIKSFFGNNGTEIIKKKNKIIVREFPVVNSLQFTVDISITALDESYLVKYRTNIPTRKALMILKDVKKIIEGHRIAAGEDFHSVVEDGK